MKRKAISWLLAGFLMLGTCVPQSPVSASMIQDPDQILEGQVFENESEEPQTESSISETDPKSKQESDTGHTGQNVPSENQPAQTVQTVPAEQNEEQKNAYDEAFEKTEEMESDSTVNDLTVPENLQEAIEALPTLEEYASLVPAEQEVIDGYVDELMNSYYEEMSNKERAEVDLGSMAALDIYTDTIAYFGPDAESESESKERNTVWLSDAELNSLQSRIYALPDLEEVVDVSPIRITMGEGPTGNVLRFSDHSAEVYYSDAQIDALYTEVYDIAAVYFLLSSEQMNRIHSGEKVTNLTGFFSVGMSAYYCDNGQEENAGSATLLSSIGSLLSGLFLTDVYAASGSVGSVSEFYWVDYSPSDCSPEMWHTGHFKVTTNNTPSGGSLAYCMNSEIPAPTGTLVTQVKGNSDIIKCLLYYGYGGPGQLASISGTNGYIETHYAISRASIGDSGREKIDTMSRNSYNKIYGSLTQEQINIAVQNTEYWVVTNGVSGTQPLCYAKFYAPVQLRKTGETTGAGISGAVYRVYSNAAGTVLCAGISADCELKTRDNGISNMLYYPIGSTIYVKEYSSPAGTKKDPAVYKVTIQGNVTNWVDGTKTKIGAENKSGSTIDKEYWRFGIIKKDASTGELVADAKYYIYTDPECTIRACDQFDDNEITYMTSDVVVTKGNAYTYEGKDENFIAYWLIPGQTYYVKEEEAPPGYQLDETVYELTASMENGSYYVTINEETTLIYTPNETRVQTAVLTVVDYPETSECRIQIKKSSANQRLTDGNSLYSLAGAVYEIYETKEDALVRSNPVTSLMTDENGESETYAGTIENPANLPDDWEIRYYVREVTAPYGYKLCDGTFDDAIEIIQKEDGTYGIDEETRGIHTITITKEDLDTVKTVTCMELPIDDPFRLNLYKQNSRTGEKVSIRMDGRPAVFVLEYWDNLDGDTQGSPKNTWFYQTDEDGYIDFSDSTGTYGVASYSFTGEQVHPEFAGTEGVSDAYYQSMTGEHIFPIGTYRIREAAAPDGYLLNGSMYFETETTDRVEVTDGLVAVIDYDPDSEEPVYNVGDAKISAENLVLIVAEEPDLYYVDLRLKKESAQIESDQTDKYSMAGAVFALSYWDGTDADTEADAVLYFQTDEEGMIDFSDPEYLLTEINLEQIEEEADPEGLSGLTLASSELYGYGTITETTDNEGKTIRTITVADADTPGAKLLYMLGTYQVKEVIPPKYHSTNGTLCFDDTDQSVPASEGIIFQLMNDTDNHPVIQYGDMLMTENQMLIQCKDEIYRASVHVVKYGKNGRTLAGVTYHLVRNEDGQDMGSLTTGSDGLALWEDLLPGSYTLTETATAEGYQLLETSIQVTVPYELTREEAEEEHADFSKAVYDPLTGMYCFYDVSFDITDSVKFSIPMTGSKGIPVTPFIFSGLFLAAGISILNRRKWKDF